MLLTAENIYETKDTYIAKHRSAELRRGTRGTWRGGYGEEINGSINIDEARDAAEMELLRRFVEARKPVMGICRGHQLINVFFGGSLIQHIDTADYHRGEGDAVQVSSLDGICEGIEHESLPLFAVQWHPERTTLTRARPDTVNGGALFDYFINLCKVIK